MSARVDSPMVIPQRIETIRVHKARGGRVAAVLPIHYPRALLRAFDILPVEVWGPPQVDATRGGAHLQQYVCSIVRNALSYLLSGDLDITDLIVVPHTCDSLQGFASILIDFVHPTQPVLPIYLPRGNRESDVAFLTDEFRSLYQRLVEFTGRTPSEVDLIESIRREETADTLLSDLHHHRRNLPLTQIEFYRLIVPLIVIDTPFIYTEASDHAIEYVKRQMEESVPIAERVVGKSLDERKLGETTRLSKMASELWLEIMERGKHRPAPISVFDQFIHMAPIVEMRGDAFTVDFYAAMLKEVDERITCGISAVKDEKKRLLWDNLPIWYRLRYLGEFLGVRGISIVASTYMNA